MLLVSVLFTIAAWVVWWFAVFFQIVRLDPIVQSFGADNSTAWFRFLVLAPPLLAGVVFGLALWYRLPRSGR